MSTAPTTTRGAGTPHTPAPAASTGPTAATAAAPAAAPDYTALIADTPDLVRAAQRLRHQVFGDELGATLDTPLPGHDVDPVDDLADHLVVVHTATDTVVGTYRLLPPGRTQHLYSDGEFDLTALDAVRPALIEAGRSCVHPDHRNGAVINQMWAALARYTLLSGHRYLAGCASVPLADGGTAATHAWALARTRHTAPAAFLVAPRRPWHPTGPLPERPVLTQLPPLLRGYLRIGAWICGAPAHDPDFGVADFFTVLDIERLGDRYRRFFLGER
ncbi:MULTISPECIES: GNAT family N-acetyltransferase [Streptomyces]|uniref:GNAT family N-acetyltransferase n=1 Tax=Streptomyces TaxID=1883 RepID=UPI001F372F03|nr:GNAT family N-acyltransferase [Streptomyces noursei]MCE4946393.1 GNAT family N-acetyltransferase [Streptomyces noursei]